MSTELQSAVFTEEKAASYLGISKAHLMRLRKAGQGPRFVRLGERRLAYRRADLDAWLEQRASAPVPAAIEKGAV